MNEAEKRKDVVSEIASLRIEAAVICLLAGRINIKAYDIEADMKIDEIHEKVAAVNEVAAEISERNKRLLEVTDRILSLVNPGPKGDVVS